MLELFLGAETLSSTIRLSVPLILACLAGLWSERSGIVDIGLEGKMLIAAFAAASTAAFDQFNKAAKQVVSLADASVRAAAESASKVATATKSRKAA